MKFKKILSLTSILLTLTTATLGQAVSAIEKPATSSTFTSQEMAKINQQDDTVITSENLNAVLESVGLDPSTFVETDLTTNNKKNVYTVGELKQAIKNSNTSNVETYTIQDSKLNLNKFCLSKSGNKPRTAIQCSHVSKIGDYSLTFSVTGVLLGDEWADVSNPAASVDTDDLMITYKIADYPTLKATFTPECITMTHKITVEKYIGIADKGLINIATQESKGTDYFYARNYLD